ASPTPDPGPSSSASSASISAPATNPPPPQTVASLTPALPAAIASVPPAPGAAMTNSIGMVLVLMPAGFWVGKYELTWAEYARVMETTNNDPRMPVNRVTWDDANEFCRRLTGKESATLKGKVYSLPTSKQWEEFRASQTLEDLPSGSLKKS